MGRKASIRSAAGKYNAYAQAHHLLYIWCLGPIEGSGKKMLETIFVILMFMAMLGASIFGWWYENYGPDKEEENK